jgi:adenylate cyclase
MSADPQERRKLAAIMFTDMVGYSALTQKNETLALELLDEHRKILRPIFLKHHGREIETTGDAFFVEFDSALDAARCAIEIQQTVHTRNSSAPAGRAIRLRIGLHLGDVVYMDQHVHGDGVNIAARIEPLANPGGICVSEDIAHQIHNKIEFPLMKLGKGELKNIQVAVQIYRILLPWEKRQSTVTDRLHFALRKKKAKTYGLLALTLAIFLTVYFVGPYKTASAGQKTIAVLPFRNISEDPRNAYFADGFTEEIMTQLANIAKLTVSPRTSVMQAGIGGKSIPDIGSELNVKNILEGSVRREDKQIQITARLIDVHTSRELWNKNYDTELTKIFDIQRDVAKKIASELRATITPDENLQLEKTTTGNLDAYDLYLRGRYAWNKRMPDQLDTSVKYFRAAIEEDPLYALAYAGLADSYTILGDFSLQPPESTYAKAKAAATRAIELDSNLAEAHTSLAYATMHFDWDWPKTDLEFKRALQLNPKSAVANSWYAIYLCAMGRFAEADAFRKHARELDPLSPAINADVGIMYYFERRYDEAIEQFEKAIKMNPLMVGADIGLGAAFEQKLMYDQAHTAFSTASQFSSGHPIAVAALAHLYALQKRREDADLHLDVLLEESQSREKYVPPFYVAAVYTGLGEKEQALTWLETAYREHDGSLIFLNVHPIFNSLRSEKRFTRLLRRLGFEGGA